MARTVAYGGDGTDVTARWGGEELLVIVNAESTDELRMKAERLCALVRRSTITHDGQRIGATVSIGGAMAVADDTVDTLIQRADRMMYQSKDQGRNQVTVTGPCVDLTLPGLGTSLSATDRPPPCRRSRRADSRSDADGCSLIPRDANSTDTLSEQSA